MSSRCLASFVLLGILAGLSACGGSSYGGGNPPPPPPGGTPSISSISPTSATAGGAGFTLTVNGSNFTSGATVGWLNPDNPGTFGRTATYVSTTQLTAQISAADIAIPSSSVQVSVVVPLLGTTPSNKVTFTINPGPPGVLNNPISVAAGGVAPNGNSHDPALSFNGRFVAFSSQATNLIAPSANFPEGYVRDSCLGADSGPPPCTPSTLLVSAITGGSASSPVEGNSQGGTTPSVGNQNFTPPSSGIPPYGRFIGFLSTATNLAAKGTTFQQAYARDTCVGAAAPTGCTPATVLASVTQSGTEPNGPTSEFAFASNTCNAAFTSFGTDVMSNVSIANEIYLASCVATGAPGSFTTSALVSASSSGVAGDHGGQQPAISADGRFVAFASKSTNLTSTLNGGFQQIYLRDACTLAPMGCAGSTTIISVDSSGNALAGDSQLPAISNDGRFVVFTTQVPQTIGVKGVVNLRDTCNSSSGPVTACTPSTTTISVPDGGGTANGTSNSSRHAVSGDGRFVVFDSSATNLVSPGTSGNQVFVRDTCASSSGSVSGCTPHTVLISTDSAGKAIGGLNAAISDDGHFAAFENQITISQIMLAATGF
jgi:trimeric autotransporter adhesin